MPGMLTVAACLLLIVIAVPDVVITVELAAAGDACAGRSFTQDRRARPCT
jgi:hypothetical protein